MMNSIESEPSSVPDFGVGVERARRIVGRGPVASSVALVIGRRGDAGRGGRAVGRRGRGGNLMVSGTLTDLPALPWAFSEVVT